MKEMITVEDKQHLKKLLSLNNPNLVKILKIDNLDSPSPVVELVSKSCLYWRILLRKCLKLPFRFKNSKSINGNVSVTELSIPLNYIRYS